MKILLFNLGTIEFRIMDWGVEGFKSLFEQDIILYGPIPNEKFKYGNKEIPILSIFESTTIKAVFDRLPEGWYPDIVTCETSVINYIPDISLCPVKTILFTRDAWSDTVFNKGLVEFFDFLNHATIDRPLYNAFHVNLLPLSNCAVTIPGPGALNSEFKTREIDVIAIATYNRAFYHDRYKTFYKLSELNKTGLNIKYVLGIRYSEIYTYYQRSKIVIDWSYTLSNRSYEAALNGCLLFSHKDNQLIKDFWIPGEEYIPYDENNLSELVEYYVNNPEEAGKIIKKAQDKVRNIPQSWGEYVWENVTLAYETDISVEERVGYCKSLPPAVALYRSATPLLFNYDYSTDYPSNWKELYFFRIDESLSLATEQHEKIGPLIEAARLAYLLKKPELSEKYLDELEIVFPGYAWIYYIKGRIYRDRGENNLALASLEKAVKCATGFPDPLKQYILPVIEHGNTCDTRRVTDHLWQSTYDHHNEYQVKALLHLSYELTGNIYERIDERENAENAYSEAIGQIPVPDCVYRIGPLLVRKKEFEKILKVTADGLEDSPYDSIMILYKAYALIQTGRKRDAYNVLKEHNKALKNFVNVRKVLLIRNSINFILLFMFFGKQPCSKIIIELIKVLKSKLGVIYLE
jgi:tetratricopeptide (TPR) repeat protein